ncbi:MAG: SDR family NAD(P)-dependent oxidoreductase, partial [Tidjanibacter sp.]|nr:SDR family NAD(P)-dependent oxidoreductase [Tidjanibacter sp.]
MTQAKKIVVIGATSGLGREMAAQLVMAGYKVGVAGRRSELLGSFVEEYKSVAVEPIEQQVMDVTATDAPSALDKLIEQMGGMDILLHVAGAGFENPTLEVGTERHITEVNSVGFVSIIDHAYHWFRTHGGVGHIAAVTSIAGTKGMGLAPAYSATKRLQTTYLSALAQHARMDGVRLHITDIRPGYAQT